MRAANMPNPHRPVTRKRHHETSPLAITTPPRRHAVIAYDAWMSAPRVTLLLCLACNTSTPAGRAGAGPPAAAADHPGATDRR